MTDHGFNSPQDLVQNFDVPDNLQLDSQSKNLNETYNSKHTAYLSNSFTSNYSKLECTVLNKDLIDQNIMVYNQLFAQEGPGKMFSGNKSVVETHTPNHKSKPIIDNVQSQMISSKIPLCVVQDVHGRLHQLVYMLPQKLYDKLPIKNKSDEKLTLRPHYEGLKKNSKPPEAACNFNINQTTLETVKTSEDSDGTNNLAEIKSSIVAKKQNLASKHQENHLQPKRQKYQKQKLRLKSNLSKQRLIESYITDKKKVGMVKPLQQQQQINMQEHQEKQQERQNQILRRTQQMQKEIQQQLLIQEPQNQPLKPIDLANKKSEIQKDFNFITSTPATVRACPSPPVATAADSTTKSPLNIYENVCTNKADNSSVGNSVKMNTYISIFEKESAVGTKNKEYTTSSNYASESDAYIKQTKSSVLMKPYDHDKAPQLYDKSMNNFKKISGINRNLSTETVASDVSSGESVWSSFWDEVSATGSNESNFSIESLNDYITYQSDMENSFDLKEKKIIVDNCEDVFDGIFGSTINDCGFDEEQMDFDLLNHILI